MPKTSPSDARRGLLRSTRGLYRRPSTSAAAKQNYGYPAAALIGALDSMSDFREMLAWFDQEEAAELRANKER